MIPEPLPPVAIKRATDPNDREAEIDWSSYFTYDPETGALFWKERPIEHFPSELAWKAWNARFNGSVAGYRNKRQNRETRAAIRIRLDGHQYMAHRVIWRMMSGPIPDGRDVRHSNRNPYDNRWINLRIIETGTIRRVITYAGVDSRNPVSARVSDHKGATKERSPSEATEAKRSPDERDGHSDDRDAQQTITP